MTAERVVRGRYIFENLADCDGCHTGSNRTVRGKGAALLPEQGVPGRIVASNITPDPDTGIGRWTDGDVEALVAFMNTLAPARNSAGSIRVNPIVNAYVRSWPRPAGSVSAPDRSDPLRYGEYLATLASCVNCHSPMVRGRPVQSKLFAGGRWFGAGRDRVRSPNITPDVDSGIGAWSEEGFVSRFVNKSCSGWSGAMPWCGLSRLTSEDLRAIYAYLRSRPAIRSK